MLKLFSQFGQFGTEFKVGLFAVIAMGTLGFMVYTIDPDSLNDEEMLVYYTILDDADGIVSKSHIKTNGVSIGKVDSVELKGNATHITMKIRAEVKIPVGSKIEKRSTGLLGDRHLEIIRAPNTEEYIENLGFIEQDNQAVDMGQLVSLIGDIAKDIKTVTHSLSNVLGNKKGEQSIQNIVDNIEGLTADLKATTKTIKSAIGDRESDIQDIVTNVRDGVKDLREFSAGLKEVLNEENRRRVDRILASFDETMVDVRSSAKNINLITAKVEKGEGTIGRLVNDDETLSELEGAIKDIRKVLAPATKLKVEVDYHSEFRKDETSQHYFNIVFRTRPDRYYLLGLTDTTNDIIEEREETLNDEPNDKTTRRTINEEKALKFNLQVAKRWHWFSLRFGLFETTGGFASDIYLFRDRFKISMEAFDWDTKRTTIRRNAHFKAYASILFYDHVYVLAGIDDPTRTDEDGKVSKDKNYFFGAGLSFNDEDLKALFGTAALVSQ